MADHLWSRTIVSLCDRTGVWCAPYRRMGYRVVQVDLAHGGDVRLIEWPGEVWGVIAQPPCSHFAGSGARWWQRKGSEALIEGLSVVDACLRIIATTRPAWWVLENPVGRLSRYLGPWAMTYDPHEYAGWADEPDAEAYTKRTCLWGRFEEPARRPVEPVLGSMMHRLPPSDDRAALRSVTPQGFARAFAAANP